MIAEKHDRHMVDTFDAAEHDVQAAVFDASDAFSTPKTSRTMYEL